MPSTLRETISAIGSTAMAGYTIAIRILIFALMPAFGIGAAAATMVGQSLGAKLPERAESAVWTAAKFNMLVLGAISIVAAAGTPLERVAPLLVDAVQRIAQDLYGTAPGAVRRSPGRRLPGRRLSAVAPAGA